MAPAQSRFELSNRVFNLLVLFFVALTIFWGFRIYEIYQQTTGSQPREISVEAQGKAYVVPDVAQINLGVSTKHEQSAMAVEENTKKVNAILAAIEAQGVEEKDIKTTQYNLRENYKWVPDEGNKQEGFILDQSILVKVRDTEKLGDIIDAASKQGATDIGSISFIVDDPDAAKDQARKEAIKKARVKAATIANQAGLSLDKVTNYYEYSDGGYYGERAYAETMSFDSAVSEKALAPSIQAGEQEVTLNVTLTYKLK